MKLLTIVCMCLTSLASFACPDFSGKFNCVDSSGDSYENLVVQTKVSEDIVSVSSTDDEGTFKYLVDGNIHALEYTGDMSMFGQKPTYKASCSGNELVVAIKLDSQIEDVKLSKAIMKVKATTADQQDFSFNFYGENNFEFLSSGSCSRIKE